jgi:hypothetical protein
VTPAEIESHLQPFDILLYRPKKGSFFGTVIQFKTWHSISHCEMYVGDGKSVASREGIGVNVYPWRPSELTWVLRPTEPLDIAGFWKWFLTVKGQKYDWWGLRRFEWFSSIPSGNNAKMFCSEFLARACRALQAKVFGNIEDADAIAPFAFILSPNVRGILTPADLQ